jgi:hypothetical protein
MHVQTIDSKHWTYNVLSRRMASRVGALLHLLQAWSAPTDLKALRALEDDEGHRGASGLAAVGCKPNKRTAVAGRAYKQ